LAFPALALRQAIRQVQESDRDPGRQPELLPVSRWIVGQPVTEQIGNRLQVVGLGLCASTSPRP
jgi:hypothetical protein